MKVNDYFEFPLEISLHKWTREGLEGGPSAEHQYTLAGVLVHSGTAEGGHYYSFIKERRTNEWFQFDDSNVTPFNLSKLKSECFGGGESNTNFYDWDNQNRSKNAYILIYERVSTQVVEERRENEQCLVERVW